MKRAALNSRRSRGVVVVFTAVSMVTLAGFAALAFDVGYLYVVQAELQKAADAAALAAAGTMFDEYGLNAYRAKRMAVVYASRNLRTEPDATYHQMDVTIGRIEAPFTLSSPFVPVADETANAVRVVVYRDRQHGNPVPLTFANVFGKTHADVAAVAIAGLNPPKKTDALPLAMRAPGFGPVDPDVSAQNPGKDGPSYPADGQAFRIGERVTVFTFGSGPRPAVHLVLDLPQFEGISETNTILGDKLKGADEPVSLSLGDRTPIWNAGTGDGKFGQKLMDRMNDGDPDNDTIVMPIVDTLPDSRDADGRLVGNVELVDFVGVHLDGVAQVEVHDPRYPDDPTRTLTVELIVGTVAPVLTRGTGTTSPAPYADGVFALQLLR